jgi:hypothetical protein
MSNPTGGNADIDWEEVILSLQAYTRFVVNDKGWFRGEKTSIFLKGKEIDDYVYGAIEKYLRNPEKFDPQRGTLILYLKRSLIRALVTNDLVSAENQTSKDVFGIADTKEDDDDGAGSYLDATLPHAEVFFDQEVDYKQIMASIEADIKTDKIVEEIFLGIHTYGMPRREVIKEFGMTDSDFDNGMKRLKTILNNTAKKFDLKKQSV